VAVFRRGLVLAGPLTTVILNLIQDPPVSVSGPFSDSGVSSPTVSLN